MLTVDTLTLEQALAHASSPAQEESLVHVSHRYQAAEFIKRSDGAFEFGRAGHGRIIGMVNVHGGVTTNVGGTQC